MDMLKPDNHENITLNFHEACKRGDLNEITKLLSRKEEIDVKQLDKEFTLGIVAQNGDLEIVELLLKIGVNVNQKIRLFGLRPLHFACKRKNLGIVQLLLQHNADVQLRGIDRKTPLHFACIEGDLEIVKELLKHKQDINAVCTTVNSLKMTPLMFAADLGYLDVVEELLNHGADIDFKDANVGNALHLAVAYGEKNVDTVKMLLKYGCNTNVRAKMTSDDEELPMCTAFELALNMKSISNVKTIAYHEN